MRAVLQVDWDTWPKVERRERVLLTDMGTVLQDYSEQIFMNLELAHVPQIPGRWSKGRCVLAHIPATMGVEAQARLEERLWAEGVKVKEEVEGVSEEAVDKPGLEL